MKKETMKTTLLKESLITSQTNEKREQDDKNKKDYLEIRIPRLNFHSNGINTYLVFILVVFSFLLGMLANKLVYLHRQIKQTSIQSNLIGGNNGPTINQNATPTSLPKVNIDMGKLPILGNTKAKVTMIEFGDFQCPFCKQYFDQTAQQVMDTYIKTGKVKFSWRYYPLVTIHPNAQKSAEAAACANDQGKFWDMHNLLFKNQDTWASQTAADAENSFVSYAQEIGIDGTQLHNCLDTNQDKSLVDADVAEGNRIGVSGTPTFVINGNVIVGAVPFSDLQKVIEEELKKQLTNE